jgi:hypothetical protein
MPDSGIGKNMRHGGVNHTQKTILHFIALKNQKLRRKIF